ncbi:unnamed protein product [Calypogeia fissa]
MLHIQIVSNDHSMEGVIFCVVSKVEENHVPMKKGAKGVGTCKGSENLWASIALGSYPCMLPMGGTGTEGGIGLGDVSKSNEIQHGWRMDSFQRMVLPALREKHDEFMLRELVKRWDNHKIMVRWLSRLFNYLERYFIARRSLPTLNEVGFMCFWDQVYADAEMKNNVKDAVITLIDREREGEKIDRPS